MIRIGPAGTPKKSTLEGVKFCKEIGLDALEVEFVYGINMSNKLAKEIGEVAKKLDIGLSVHAPYYINLSSLKKENIVKGKEWILTSCERAHHLNARYVVFHPGFYHKRDKKDVFDIILNNILDLRETLRERGLDVELAPETTGKINAFGDLDEIIDLIKKAKCKLCVDFAHLYARNNGKINYDEIFKRLSELKHIHCHFSGMEYTKKGERRHLNLSSNKPSFKELAKTILKRKPNITIICETPRQYLDCLDMKGIFKKLGYKF